MSLLHLDLSEYNIYSNDLEEYKECVNLVKLANRVADTNEFSYIRKKKAKRVKELLKNLKEDWFCECCKKQSFSQRGYNTHVSSTEHKAKSIGKEMKLCSNRKCRKKCVGNEGLEQHLRDSPVCIADCHKNKCAASLFAMKKMWEREKELYMMKNNIHYRWTKAEKVEYNRMIRKHQSQNPEGWGLLTMNEKGLLEGECIATDPEPETNFYNTAPIIVSDLPEGFAGHDDWEENMKSIQEKIVMETALQAQEQWEMEQQKIKDYEDKMEQLGLLEDFKIVNTEVLEGMVPTEEIKEV